MNVEVISFGGDDLNRLKEALANEMPIHPDKAAEQGLCCECGMPALDRCYSEAGRKEYRISKLCEICYDNMFMEPEEGEE